MTFDSRFDSDDNNVPMKTQTQKPIHEVRLGTIKAAVWRNETGSGVRYNVTFSRIYKTQHHTVKSRRFERYCFLLHGISYLDKIDIHFI